VANLCWDTGLKTRGKILDNNSHLLEKDFSRIPERDKVSSRTHFSKQVIGKVLTENFLPEFLKFGGVEI